MINHFDYFLFCVAPFAFAKSGQLYLLPVAKLPGDIMSFEQLLGVARGNYAARPCCPELPEAVLPLDRIAQAD